MKRWKSGAGRSLILSVGVFVCVFLGIHKARQFANAAPRERMAAARDVSRRYYPEYGLRFNFYSCSYGFIVAGEPYVGRGDCPQLSASDGSSPILWDSGGTLVGANVAVYYDPAEPSLSSLVDFSTMSRREYRYMIPWDCLAISILLAAVFFALLDANEKKPAGAVIVDNKGTVIYPEAIDIGTEFGGASAENRKPERPFNEANRRDVRVADFAPPSGLRDLYLEVVNQIHPDRAMNESDQVLREKLMKEANAAFERCDSETLQRVVEEYRNAVSGRQTR